MTEPDYIRTKNRRFLLALGIISIFLQIALLVVSAVWPSKMIRGASFGSAFICFFPIVYWKVIPTAAKICICVWILSFMISVVTIGILRY